MEPKCQNPLIYLLFVCVFVQSNSWCFCFFCGMWLLFGGFWFLLFVFKNKAMFISLIFFLYFFDILFMLHLLLCFPFIMSWMEEIFNFLLIFWMFWSLCSQYFLVWPKYVIFNNFPQICRRNLAVFSSMIMGLVFV